MEILDLELTTKIPIEKLVPAICEFYWAIGHKTIKIIRGSDDNKTSDDYDSTKEIRNIEEITEISVHTYRKNENYHVFFDSVNIALAKRGSVTQVMWNVDLGFRIGHLIYVIYFIISFVVPYYCALNMCPVDYHSPWYRYCFVLYFTFFGTILVLPMYYLIDRKIKKLESHPSTERYKRDFEEFIHKKEKEFLSERY
jgi:hypothetical protein